MLTTLQHSLNAIFDLYKQKDRGLYNFSFLFLLISSVIASVFTLITLYFANSLYVLGEFGVDYSFYELITQPMVWFHLKNCNMYYTTACIGLYSSYLQTVLLNPEEKMTLGNFFKFMDTKYWIRFLAVMAVLVLFYSVTFVDLFEIGPLEQEGVLGLLQNEEMQQDPQWTAFYYWLNNVIQLLGTFLPYFAAFFLVLWNEYPVMNFSFLKIFRKYIWLCLVISFCLLSLSNNLIDYLNEYFIKILMIPFKIYLAGMIVSTIATWLILALFYPAVAGAVLFPIIKNDEISRNTELDLEQENKVE